MAKRFVFKLDTLLELRRRRQDEKKRIVAGRQQQINDSRRHMDVLNGQIQYEFDRSQQSRQTPQLDVPLLARQRYWISSLQHQVLDSQGYVHRLEQQLHEDRLELAEAAKEVKVLEKLRQKALEEYRRQQQRRERIDEDELGTQWYNRQQSEG